MSYRTLSASLGFMALVTLAIAAAILILQPANDPGAMPRWKPFVAAACMLGVWIVAGICERFRPLAKYSKGERRLFIFSTLIMSGTLITGSLALKLFEMLGPFADITPARSIGVLSGLMLMIMGNFMPKVHVPRREKRCHPGDTAAFHRSAGFFFFLGGLGMVLCWLTLPITSAKPAAIACCLASVAVTLIRMIIFARMEKAE